MTIFLETNRLILKLAELSDLDNLIKLRSDPDVMKYIGDGSIHTEEKIRTFFFKVAVPYQEKYGFGFCSVFEKETDEFIGQAGLFHKGFYDEQPDIELAYRLHKKYWGKGYATELAKALVRWGFENIKIDKIVAAAAPENIASQKVLLKTGFLFLGKQQWGQGREVFYYEIYKNDAIELSPYNKEWPEMAAREIKKLYGTLPNEHIIDIQHVGSTAVPGMLAKPVIDIQIAVDSLMSITKTVIDRLKIENYIYWEDNPDKERMFFVKGMPPFGERRTIHLHIVGTSSRHWREKIWFRDYLRSCPEGAIQYEQLKRELAKKHTYDREEYTNEKTKFIQDILIKVKKLGKTEKVEVVSYNKKWPILFEIEARYIKEALGDNCVAIHHIGSTAVPGLSAKPIIDMLPVVKDVVHVKSAVSAMEKLGYESKGEYGMLFRHYFIKRWPSQCFNVHVFEEHHPDIERHLKFRDWMRTHPDDREAYKKLKLDLALTFPNDIFSYVSGKDKFVDSIDEKTGHHGTRVVLALKNQEWETLRHFRQKYFFDLVSVKDPYTWTFKNKDHAHIVFYKGTKIVGYAHIQFWPEKRAVLRIIVIDTPYRHQGLGGELLKICERWLQRQGTRLLQVESRPEVLPFYVRHGYIQMPFNDPEGHEAHSNDIAMGKSL